MVKVLVSISVPLDFLKMIDRKKGSLSRSKYLLKLLDVGWKNKEGNS